MDRGVSQKLNSIAHSAKGIGIKSFPLCALLYALCSLVGFAEEWDFLNSQEQTVLNRILAHWETWVPQMKKEGRAPLMTFEEIYQGLDEEAKAFLERMRAIRPEGKNYLGLPEPSVSFQKITGQKILRNGRPEQIDPQYLPQDVCESYERMMQAMQKDLGKRLFVESGYRSPAYQLYTFLFYTPKHHYSIKETRQWVALPGYSEHGAPQRQAMDFINEEGINGDDAGQTAEDFERLPEYEWLTQNAPRLGFELSYPRGNPDTTFEPWHWRRKSSAD